MLAVCAAFLGIGTIGLSQNEAKQTLHGMVRRPYGSCGYQSNRGNSRPTHGQYGRAA